MLTHYVNQSQIYANLLALEQNLLTFRDSFEITPFFSGNSKMTVERSHFIALYNVKFLQIACSTMQWF